MVACHFLMSPQRHMINSLNSLTHKNTPLIRNSSQNTPFGTHHTQLKHNIHALKKNECGERELFWRNNSHWYGNMQLTVPK